jgi:integrase
MSIIDKSKRRFLMGRNIEDAAKAVLEFLKGIPVSDRTVKYYRSCYRTINRFCQSNDIDHFTDRDMKSFIECQIHRHESGEISLIYALIQRKAAVMLADQMRGKELAWGRRNYKHKRLRDSYENTLQAFGLYLKQSLSRGSIQLVVQVVRQFLVHLENVEAGDLNRLTLDEVRRFIIGASPRYKSSMVNLVWPIKRFLSYLDNVGLARIEAQKVFVHSIPRRTKALPCFTTAEAKAILGAVDTSTPLGKRDYAILKIAVGTGLRGEDIFGLRLPDIDWKKNEIRVVQSKTGKSIMLPLMPDVGNAIADYILNARPQAENAHVFLRHRKPHTWLGESPAGSQIIKRYQGSAGILHEAGDGKTFHAFRRTVGTRLIKAGVPLSSAAQILGHKRIESTKRYISLNNDTLRECCMDISDYATKKEGLV